MLTTDEKLETVCLLDKNHLLACKSTVSDIKRECQKLLKKQTLDMGMCCHPKTVGLQNSVILDKAVY